MSRSEQWEAYYAARAKALRAEAAAHRMYAEAERIWPPTGGPTNFHDDVAIECDRKAAELEAKEPA